MTSSTIPFRSAPLGCVFKPTDEELINHFLKLKMIGGRDHEMAIISEVNVCNYEPWELPGHSAIQSNDQECYFFSPRNYMYSNNQRVNRTPKAGFSKVTGKDRIIRGAYCYKKDFDFPQGSSSLWNQDQLGHEYNPTYNFHNRKDFVLCKLKKKPDDTLTFEKGESTSNVASNFRNNAEVRSRL